ncbi:hypothetical protein SCLCIDRAFT_29706 [Scleroderma citrinum Foug A]|uniref:Uncharacterized protein n=1 Tax=Scleroderma citrinum Foug A TaxID=1036808 RepID=A0A0C3DJL7_9AGAM|nr:hypothetical protein SCLCIDRAFT_29706 [Scleroderma citrinum Foug A]
MLGFLPPQVVGHKFRLTQDDLLYCVHVIEVSEDGCQFSIQFEDLRNLDLIGPDEMKWMLQNSDLVE